MRARVSAFLREEHHIVFVLRFGHRFPTGGHRNSRAEQRDQAREARSARDDASQHPFPLGFLGSSSVARPRKSGIMPEGLGSSSVQILAAQSESGLLHACTSRKPTSPPFRGCSTEATPA